ncbi:uncharacterized protein LOC117209540 isoform X1 [Bombus bifarius]|uniref:Uncharacterized protein LOC117209540 isoform X1 n=1 Tax=Bombus bifarius TaxID=103933 RepID=A0A6P8MZ46_9HYME|nr:uncharacterized protein LOC117158376 isoform X1 [Bombus vancouverensis nearcticus]XP_033307570.1 uncharacterized protein LOC117209540 isoform X1 [Bombus bifarius]
MRATDSLIRIASSRRRGASWSVFPASWIVVDRRSSRGSLLWTEYHRGRPFGIRFSTVLAALGTCGTSGPPIARDPDPRTALILFGFELTDLSRSVLLQAIVPESCRSQAHRVSVEMHNYIELRYKLC